MIFPSVDNKIKQESADVTDFIDDFPMIDNLEVDMANQIDGNEKPKKKKNCICRICQKSFRDNYKLKRHEKVHIKAGEMLPGKELFRLAN